MTAQELVDSGRVRIAAHGYSCNADDRRVATTVDGIVAREGAKYLGAVAITPTGEVPAEIMAMVGDPYLWAGSCTLNSLDKEVAWWIFLWTSEAREGQARAANSPPAVHPDLLATDY